MAASCFVVPILVGSIAVFGIVLMVDAAKGHHITATTAAAATATATALVAVGASPPPPVLFPSARHSLLVPLLPLLGWVLMGAAECQAGDELGVHAGARLCALRMCALQPGWRDA
jgi:hypothetical protein